MLITDENVVLVSTDAGGFLIHFDFLSIFVQSLIGA